MVSEAIKPWEDDDLRWKTYLKLKKKNHVVDITGYKWKEIVSHIRYFVMNVGGRIGGRVS